jgi:hypothetical protein
MSSTPDFIKLANGNYVNLKRCKSVYAIGSASTWSIEVDYDGGGLPLAGGPYTSEGAAQSVIKQTIDGVSAEDFLN